MDVVPPLSIPDRANQKLATILRKGLLNKIVLLVEWSFRAEALFHV
jgi:hypothetical protein